MVMQGDAWDCHGALCAPRNDNNSDRLPRRLEKSARNDSLICLFLNFEKDGFEGLGE